MAVKNYVLDTNVLLHDARSMFAFGDNAVVIPIYVIEEIDTFKKDQSELGRNARQIARLLDEHRSKPGGLS
ncbi:MAG TPA: PIN domain-containing protein, partial [Kofleriaceae bacterium]